jgi:2-polyprenyl-3-methyl-5-hydroxy-6-metoxy-1,4-benzoquinol methylase
MKKCICGSVKFKHAIKSDPRSCYTCMNCNSGLIYPFPFENSDDASSFYNDDNYLDSISLDEYYGYYSVFKKKLISLNVKDGTKILDFGCGKGLYVKFLAEDKFDSVGYDVNKVQMELNRNNYGLKFYDNFEKINTKFDIVISNMVVEHLVNPFEVINNDIYDILKPGGRFIFTVPNYASLNRRILGKNWLGLCLEDHVYIPNKKSVKYLVDHAKYDIESLDITSSLNTKEDAWRPKGLVKKLYKNIVMRLLEYLHNGDQILISLVAK